MLSPPARIAAQTPEIVPNSLRIDVHRERGAAVLRVSGELDVASAAELESGIASASAEGPKLLVLDLSCLDFMDSTGLRALLSAQELASQAGQRFGVLRGPQQVERLLELTRVADRLEIADDLEQLLAVVGAHARSSEREDEQQ